LKHIPIGWIVSVAVRSELADLYHGPQPISDVRWRTVGEVFTGLPAAQESTSSNVLKNHVPSREGLLNKRRVAYVDMGMGRMSVPAALQLNCHSKYGGHLDVYGRLDWFAQARTITGGFDSFTRGEYAHPFEHRSITPREAARLQGFPDDFEFIGNRSAIRHQIGNAVPPPMAEAIGKALIDIVNA
jgi:DNA (cytosine-5)-methyltransferase 1